MEEIESNYKDLGNSISIEGISLESDNTFEVIKEMFNYDKFNEFGEEILIIIQIINEFVTKTQIK